MTARRTATMPSPNPSAPLNCPASAWATDRRRHAQGGLGRAADRPDDLLGQVSDRGRRLGQRRRGRHAGRAGRGPARRSSTTLSAQRPRAVFPALGQSVALEPDEIGALGVIETFSGVSVLAAADARRQGRPHDPLPHPRGHGPGRQGLVPDDRQRWPTCAPGVQAAADEARHRGLLVSEIVIPRPSRELFGDYLLIQPIDECGPNIAVRQGPVDFLTPSAVTLVNWSSKRTRSFKPMKQYVMKNDRL